MGWRSGKRILGPLGGGGWRDQFAMLPTPYAHPDGFIRLLLGFCDPQMVGSVGYIDLASDDPSRVLRISENPVLGPGDPGCFDDNGVVPISLLKKDDTLLLYYIGFQLGVKFPYTMFCGLARSNDHGLTFERVSKAPILDRNEEELFARCGCHVMRDGERLRMWYVGSVGDGWVRRDGKLVPLYTVRHISSIDGVHWTPEIGTPCLDFADEDEHGFGRPFVEKFGDRYEMIVSVRSYSRGYYLARATSTDGLTWNRIPGELAIIGAEDSNSGWDDENRSYAHTLEIGGRRFLFYNGNGCGKSGVGLALWTESE